MSGATPPPDAALASLSALLILTFAVLSLEVARRTPPPLATGAHRGAWRLAGVAFAVTGAHATAGAVSAWAGVLLPGGPASRATVLGVLATALLWMAGREGKWRAGAATWAALVLAPVAGATAAWWLPRVALAPATVAMAAGVGEAAVVLLLLLALFAALLRDVVDRLLWAALALFALEVAAGAGLPLLGRGLAPVAPGLEVAVLLAMVGLAARRLALARRGARVPSLLDPLWPRRMGTAR